MKDILELIKLLVQGNLNIAVNITVTGTVDVRDPDDNYIVFSVPPADPVG